MLVTGHFHNGVIELPEEFRNLKEDTVIKVEIPDEQLDNINTDYLESINNEETKKLMYDLRKIRGTGPTLSDNKSEKELLFEAFQLMKEEGKLI